MSHIHLPDGVIPVFWWLTGFLLAGIMLNIAFYKTKDTSVRRRTPLLGIMSALMIIAQSIPLGFIPFHLGLAVLAGIILGPWLGVIAVFSTTFFLALIGHGGITVVGLNTLVVGSEAFLGYFLFRLLKRFFAIPLAGGIATVFALIVSTSLMVGVVALSQINPAALLEHIDTGATEASKLSVRRFVEIIVPFAVVGIFIESFVNAIILRFLLSVRPDIVEAS